MANNPYMYAPYTPYPPQRGFQQPTYQVQPVGSKEEATAATVDYFSLGLIMPVPGQNIMYFKRFNQNTGQSDFVEFVARQPEPPVQYVTRQEFDELKKMLGGNANA